MQKSALITGAARGIGLATAQIFQASGYRVALLDRNEEALTAAAALLPKAKPMLFDLALPETAAQVAAQIAQNLARLKLLSTMQVWPISDRLRDAARINGVR